MAPRGLLERHGLPHHHRPCPQDKGNGPGQGEGERESAHNPEALNAALGDEEVTGLAFVDLVSGTEARFQGADFGINSLKGHRS